MNTILTDLIPAKARKYVYALIGLLAIIYGAYQGSDGDWGQTIASLLVTLFAATAVSNTDVTPKVKPVMIYRGYTERSQEARDRARLLNDGVRFEDDEPVADDEPDVPPLPR